MTKRQETMWSGRAVLRFAVLTGGLVLISSVGLQPAQAQSEPCTVLCGVVNQPLARGPFQNTDQLESGDFERIDLQMQAHVGGKVESAHVKAAADVVVAQITIHPGGFIGWHSHPGPAIVVVKTGTLTIYDPEGSGTTCSDFRSYGPNQSFVDLGQGHIHNAKNHSAEDVLVFVTYLDVPAGSAPLQLEQAQGAFCTLPVP